ncbi:MAG: hypothetical protein O9264_06220 [Leptospira sp.]|nr:hypothetical protein [Leptospira sp.]
MRQKISLIMMITAFALLANSLAGSPSAKTSSEMMPTPFDPNKKKVGEECKVSDECQKHHACTKSGDKNICTAPPRQILPPNTVT